MIIKLDAQQMFTASSVGLKRHVFSMSKDLKHRFGAKSSDASTRLYKDVIGACGEMAGGIATGAYWMATVGTRKEPDLLPNWQVRTAEKHNHRLYVGQDDADADRFLFVTVEIPGEFHIQGWMFGFEAKVDAWKTVTNAGVDCWMVPASALRPIRDQSPLA